MKEQTGAEPCWKAEGGTGREWDSRQRERVWREGVEPYLEWGIKNTLCWKIKWSVKIAIGGGLSCLQFWMQSTASVQPVWDSRDCLKWRWQGPSVNLPVDHHKPCTCSGLHHGAPPFYTRISIRLNTCWKYAPLWAIIHHVSWDIDYVLSDKAGEHAYWIWIKHASALICPHL